MMSLQSLRLYYSQSKCLVIVGLLITMMHSVQSQSTFSRGYGFKELNTYIDSMLYDQNGNLIAQYTHGVLNSSVGVFQWDSRFFKKLKNGTDSIIYTLDSKSLLRAGEGVYQPVLYQIRGNRILASRDLAVEYSIDGDMPVEILLFCIYQAQSNSKKNVSNITRNNFSQVIVENDSKRIRYLSECRFGLGVELIGNQSEQGAGLSMLASLNVVSLRPFSDNSLRLNFKANFCASYSGGTQIEVTGQKFLKSHWAFELGPTYTVLNFSSSAETNFGFVGQLIKYSSKRNNVGWFIGARIDLNRVNETDSYNFGMPNDNFVTQKLQFAFGYRFSY